MARFGTGWPVTTYAPERIRTSDLRSAAGADPGNGNGPRGTPQSGGSNGRGPFDNLSSQFPNGRGWMLGVCHDMY
jgi:hypothetical protein